MTTSSDELVRDYLDRLGRAAAGLPPTAREELLEQIADHIEAARADALAAGDGDGPAVVRGVLDRLGPPAEVAAAAASEQPAGAGARRPIRLFGEGSGRESAAVVLCGVGWILGLGWVLGLILALTSPRWSARQKLLVALLPVPAWLLLGVAHQIGAADGPALLIGAIAVIAFVVPLLLGARLVRQAR